MLCGTRPPVPYDAVSLDIGSSPNVGAVPGAARHAIPVKPIDGFLARFEELRARVLAGRSRHVLLVGGGAGGVELLLSVERRLRRDAPDQALRFTLVTGSSDILPSFPPAFRARFRRILAARGIALRTDARVIRVDEAGVRFTEGGIDADEVLWTTEASPARWLAGTGLALDPHGFLRVDAALRAVGRDDVFAAGDMVAFDPGALPRSGVYAVRAGPVLAANLRAAATGHRSRHYRPQSNALYVVSTGERCAVATRNGLTLGGAWAWHLKDHLDRRFMARFNDGSSRAKACGGRAGMAALHRGHVETFARPEAVAGVDAAEFSAAIDAGSARLSVRTVSRCDIRVDDPYLFGQIAATHALGDAHAMGAAPRTALALAAPPSDAGAAPEADLADMVLGATRVLRSAGCALVGVRAGEGAGPDLLFLVDGLIGRNAPPRAPGLRPGDALVLTKPLGTGALLAADWCGQARGRWMQAAFRHMVSSNQAAARVLAAHGAGAVAHVAELGLLGHLKAMLAASGTAAWIEMSWVPALDGAREMLAQGVASPLLARNQEVSRLAYDAEATSLPPLLFDPQMAGPLLAGIPAARADACVEALRAAGYCAAAVVGAVTAREEGRGQVSVKAGTRASC